jgi:predicted ATPase
VGRREELAALHAAFEAANDGNGLVVCVTGEPGLGKTTLVDEFLDDQAASDRRCGLGRGHCSERLAGTEAYLPFLEALESLLVGSDGAAIAQVMKLVAPTWYVQLVPQAVHDPSLARVLADAQGASQERLKRDLGLFLQEVSRLRPLVLFLDDVHWADVSTVDLLAYLGIRCTRLRLLLVLTYRPADLLVSQHSFGPVKLELQGRGILREIALPFLSRDDHDRYLALAFPGHDFPDEFAAVIHARTGGNPLFMVDLLRYLCDRAILVETEGRWTLAQPVPDFQRELPESVRSMIRRKIDQLSEGDRSLLKAASVQGPEFDSAVVARVLGREAAEVEERLETLECVHAVVHLVRVQEFPDRTLTLRYRFVHVLYQNTLYAALQPTRKAAWSATAALSLLDHYGEKCTAVAAELALLHEAARDPARAAHYFLMAAENAVRLAAHHEAAALARRGLDLLQTLPATPERSRQELNLLLALGVSLLATKGFAAPEVEQTYLRARELCQRSEDIPTLFPVLYGLWNVYLVRCALDQCTELAGQMFALAEDKADPVYLLVAHNVLQQPLFHLGDFAAARHNQERGLARYDARQHRNLTAVYGEDPGVGCLVYGAATFWLLGFPDQALRSLEAGRRLAEELANPFNVAQSLYYGAFTLLARRDVDRAREWAAALMELCGEQGFSLLFAGGAILHGWTLTFQGQMEEGLRRMREGLAAWQATGAVSHRHFHLALLAEALGRSGQAMEGLNFLAESLALVHNNGEAFWEAELYRLQGELLVRRGDGEPSERESGETCFRRSLDVARRQQARGLELRAALGASRLYKMQGRTAEARQVLAETYSWFSEGFDTLDLQEARALLDELG